MKSTTQFNAMAILATGALVALRSCEQRDEKGTDPGGTAHIEFRDADNPGTDER